MMGTCRNQHGQAACGSLGGPELPPFHLPIMLTALQWPGMERETDSKLSKPSTVT